MKYRFVVGFILFACGLCACNNRDQAENSASKSDQTSGEMANSKQFLGSRFTIDYPDTWEFRVNQLRESDAENVIFGTSDNVEEFDGESRYYATNSVVMVITSTFAELEVQGGPSALVTQFLNDTRNYQDLVEVQSERNVSINGVAGVEAIFRYHIDSSNLGSVWVRQHIIALSNDEVILLFLATTPETVANDYIPIYQEMANTIKFN